MASHEPDRLDNDNSAVAGNSGGGGAFRDLYDVAFGIGEPPPVYKFPTPAPVKQDLANTFTILINSASSTDSVVLLVRPDTSIEELRDRACDRFGWWSASRYVWLSFDGAPLDEGRRLRDYGIDSFEKFRIHRQLPAPVTLPENAQRSNSGGD